MAKYILYKTDKDKLLVCTKDGSCRIFDSFMSTVKYMIEHHCICTVLKSIGYCRRCGQPLFKSVMRVHGYEYQCFECDEDFYAFEQEPIIKKPHNNAVFK